MTKIFDCFLDTETTGIALLDGHRLIEIACIITHEQEIIDQFHYYLNPQRPVSQGAYQVHKISDAFLKDKPLFESIADELIDIISGHRLIIHNAPFDISFINGELKRIGHVISDIESICYDVVDSLTIARALYPKQRNNLDALCRRHQISLNNRQAHGALIDAELLAQVFWSMSQKQDQLDLNCHKHEIQKKIQDNQLISSLYELKKIHASPEEIKRHEQYLKIMPQNRYPNA